MRESKLRVAIVGAGMIANSAHIPAFKCLSDKAEIVGVCDTYPESAEGTAKRNGIPGWYTDSEKMITELKPDIVTVCTPNTFHKATAKFALEHGAHVICEKPLAMTYKDTKELFDLAEEKKKVLVACQVHRYRDDNSFAKEMVETGVLGDIYYSDIALLRRRGVPKWGTFHIKEINGGGALCDLGVHIIDSALWIMGNPKFMSASGFTSSYLSMNEENIVSSLAESGAPSGVLNTRSYSPKEFEVEEFVTAALRFENGSVMNVKAAWAINLPNTRFMHFAGTKSGLSLPEMQLYTTMGRYQADMSPRVFPENRKYAGVNFAGHHYLMENIVEHLQNGTDLAIKPEETLNVTAIIDAIYRSAEIGREVAADEILV